ncbi:glutamate receptor ionotropic, kainate glr-3-like [Haliotis asinina]|uniref:glutamate receptor ionotropic, kainate glr-3-like n=1 Tax=Haliotis asinina TaxID=109174 RepID=UPI003531D19F
MQMFIFIVYTSSNVLTLSVDILLNIKAYEKCAHPVVCRRNDSVNSELMVTTWLISAEKQFAVCRTARSVHGDMGILASLSSCQRQFGPSSCRDDLNVSVCSVVCPTLFSSHAIYIKSVFNVTSTKQSYFDVLVRPDSMGDVMRGITSIVNHVKWKTFVVITSSYQVLTALSEEGLASIRLMLYMIDEPNTLLESIVLASIYQLLPEEDLKFLVICPSDCIEKLLNQAHWLESNMSVMSSTGFSQWLMVPSAGSVTDIGDSREPFKTDDVVFLEFMPCSRYFPPLDLQSITKNLSSVSKKNMTEQAVDSADCTQRTATVSDSSIQAKLQVLRPSHTGTAVEIIGKIGRDGNLEVKQQLFHESEYGFQNRTLTVATLEWAPFVIKRVENGSVRFDGLCIDLLQELGKQLNFSYTLVEPEDREWSRILNGSWTGLVKSLVSGEADMIVAPMTVTQRRATDIDFTVPYVYVHSALILSKQDPNTNKWLTLLSLFRSEVLVCVIASLIFSTVFRFVMEEVTPVRSWTDAKHPDIQTRYGHILYSHFGALVANGGAYIPSPGSGRIVLACWWIFAVILASTYRGNLIAFLTDRREIPPFSNLAEMVQQDMYKWGFVGGTSLFNLFQESNISVYHKVWNGVEEIMANEPDWLSLDGDEHMRRVVESQYVYLAEESTLEMWDDPRRCDLQMLRDNFYFSKYAIGLPKRSAYTQLFSKQILRIYESGLLHLWWDRWKPKHRCVPPSTKAKRVDILTLQSAFYGAGVGVTMALLALVCEIIRKQECKTKTPTTA